MCPKWLKQILPSECANDPRNAICCARSTALTIRGRHVFLRLLHDVQSVHADTSGFSGWYYAVALHNWHVSVRYQEGAEDVNSPLHSGECDAFGVAAYNRLYGEFVP